MQCKRFRGKLNLQRPRKPHFDRALFNAIAEPIYQRYDAIDRCQHSQQEKKMLQLNPPPVHPFSQILTRELFQCFEEANMILLCQKNSMIQYEYFNFRVACHKKNIKTKIYGRNIIELALRNTRFEAMLEILLATSYNCMLFGNEWNVKDALNIMKKTPKMILLAGSLGDRFLSRSQLEEVAKTDITTERARIVATLNSIGSQLTNHLASHQSTFCYMLDAHAETLKNSSNTKTNDEDEASK